MKLQRYKRDSDVSYALGATLVAELFFVNPTAITRVFVRPTDKQGQDLQRFITRLQSKNCEIIESTKAFNILGAKENCLLIAEFKKDLIKKNTRIFNHEKAPTDHLILVNPSDAGNLGTIMRSAAAFHFDRLTIVTPAVDPFGPKVVRASMGAIFHLNIEVVDALDNNLEDCFAFVLDKDATPLNKIKRHPAAIILGNEAAGLPKDFCKKTGAKPVYIRQSENVDSLNLGVAASIAMHYFDNLPEQRPPHPDCQIRV